MINRAPFLTLSLTNIAKGFSWKATPPSRMMAASEVEDIFFCKATLTLPSVRPDEKIFVYNMTYRKVASNSMSRLVAHLMIFIRLMKGKFDAYVVWPLAKKFQNWIVDRSTARDFTVSIVFSAFTWHKIRRTGNSLAVRLKILIVCTPTTWQEKLKLRKKFRNTPWDSIWTNCTA